TLIDRLAEHCHDGWGEVEIHLHHGVDAPDTSEATWRVLVDFRDELASRGCLPRWNGQGSPRYAFVHGNWALANSAGGRYCRVDGRLRPGIEQGVLVTHDAPTAVRLRLWQQSGIGVVGRPDWAFIKLSCHGMDPRDEPVMLGAPIRHFLKTLIDAARDGGDR